MAAVLLAPACAACDNLLDEPTRGVVCASCWQSIRPITPPYCERCGDPLPAWRIVSTAAAQCPRCRRRPSFVDRSRAIGEYEGSLRAIVHALKYDGRRSLAHPLGQLMRLRAADLVAGADIAVPVPLHRSRRRRRGFNQAADLARHLGVPVCAALKRTRATATQADLPAAQRHRNVRNAFAPTKDASSIEGAIVLLVDDVSTTGATLEACARILKSAGAREVRALTAARVVSWSRLPGLTGLTGRR